MDAFSKKLQKKLIAHYYRGFAFAAGAVLLAVPIVNAVLPDAVYSSSEKRNLVQFPVLSVSTLTGGEFMDGMEDYEADQFVGRDLLMNLKIQVGRLMGKRESEGVYLCSDGYLMERFDGDDGENMELTTKAVLDFASRYSTLPMYFMLVPNAVSELSELLPADAPTEDQNAYIDSFYQKISSAVTAIDVRETLSSRKESTQIYYRTDHHWTTDAAFAAYVQAVSTMGLNGAGEMYAAKTVCSDFSGSLVSKSGFSPETYDSIHVYFPPDDSLSYVVTYGEENTKAASCYQADKLDGEDPYQVFFGGNHTVMTIETTADSERSLLVFKDSYANCFLPFLFGDFKSITVVDPRYYYDSIDSLVLMNSFTDVLYLYNANTLAEDTNLRMVLENE